MKRCSVCKVEKPIEEFHRSKQRKDGRHPECKPCRSTAGPPKPLPTHRRCPFCGEMKPLGEFYPRRTSESRIKRQRLCKPCAAERGRLWRKGHPGYYHHRLERNPTYFRDRKLRRLYGITLAEYEQLLAQQGGVCAICEAPDPPSLRGSMHPLVVDHDHSTGRVRGLLCVPCNAGLGALERADWMPLALAYLERSRDNGAALGTISAEEMPRSQL